MSRREFTEVWWDRRVEDRGLLHAWLPNLREAEGGGAGRFQRIVDEYKPNGRALEKFRLIIEDELRHKLLVEMVMVHRGLPLSDTPAGRKERYWDAVWEGVNSFETACAAGAYGEMLALNRFRVIHSHEGTPPDIRMLVQLILPDEKRHAIELHQMAGDAAMNAMRPFHEAGMRNLGLPVGVDGVVANE